MREDYGEFEMVNGCVANRLCNRVKELEAFIDSITDILGPYPEINNTQLVQDAYHILSSGKFK